MECRNSSAVARNRLSVITAHLAADSDSSSSSPVLETSTVSASSAALSPPPNLKGALKIIDERTGKKYQVPVTEEGTIKATDFKKVSKLLFSPNFTACWMLVTYCQVFRL